MYIQCNTLVHFLRETSSEDKSVRGRLMQCEDKKNIINKILVCIVCITNTYYALYEIPNHSSLSYAQAKLYLVSKRTCIYGTKKTKQRVKRA